MANVQSVEVFSAGCPLCEDTVALVNRIAGLGKEVRVLDMRDPAAARRAKELGVTTVPAVAVGGELASCCRGAGPNEADLRAALAAK